MIDSSIERAARNIISIIQSNIDEAIATGELPSDILIEGFRITEDLSMIEVDLSNNLTMQIEVTDTLH
jgi:hypothetical protein